MVHDYTRNLKYDRRLLRRRGWVDPEELAHTRVDDDEPGVRGHDAVGVEAFAVLEVAADGQGRGLLGRRQRAVVT